MRAAGLESMKEDVVSKALLYIYRVRKDKEVTRDTSLVPVLIEKY